MRTKHNIRLNILPRVAQAEVIGYRAVTLDPLGGVRHAQAGEYVLGFSDSVTTLVKDTVDVTTAGVVPAFFVSAVKCGDPVGVDSDGMLKVVGMAAAVGVAGEDADAGSYGSVYLR